jgi:hypothetical protein
MPSAVLTLSDPIRRQEEVYFDDSVNNAITETTREPITLFSLSSSPSSKHSSLPTIIPYFPPPPHLPSSPFRLLTTLLLPSPFRVQ